MLERPQYTNAPIVEAVIDLRVSQPSSLTVGDLQVVAKENEDQYPIVESEFVYQGEGHLEEAGAPLQQETEHWHNGFRCTSGDRRRTFYARLDGFALSVRAPYEGWEQFRDEAYRLWREYESASAPTYITRIGVRYINRLDIPREAGRGVNLENYTNIYPEMPNTFPPVDGPTTMFFLQVQVPQPDIKSMVVVNSTPEAPATEYVVSVILDFDLFSERSEEPWDAEDEDTMWEFLETLHERKNDIFEASITDQTRGLIQ